jgi:hypothetical protein
VLNLGDNSRLPHDLGLTGFIAVLGLALYGRATVVGDSQGQFSG